MTSKITVKARSKTSISNDTSEPTISKSPMPTPRRTSTSIKKKIKKDEPIILTGRPIEVK